jgi:hypothetical protein
MQIGGTLLLNQHLIWIMFNNVEFFIGSDRHRIKN